MIYTVLKIVLFVLVFFLGIELGAGAIEYDKIEQESTAKDIIEENHNK